ncbi:MAG: hypothetical protein IPI55_11445 [Flavobacteriales bacterium]|nr:hypothetical protein [Flavobacteriales bacterium]
MGQERTGIHKRAAFALLAGCALHGKKGPDEQILLLVKKAACDERNFVKKGVSWALRGMANTGSDMHATVVDLAEELAASTNATERWVGKDVLRDINRPMIAKRAEKRDTKRTAAAVRTKTKAKRA